MLEREVRNWEIPLNCLNVSWKYYFQIYFVLGFICLRATNSFYISLQMKEDGANKRPRFVYLCLSY
jgi:hypothetical protein